MKLAANWTKHPERVVGKWFHYKNNLVEYVFIVRHIEETRYEYGISTTGRSRYFMNRLANLAGMEECSPPNAAPQGIVRAVFEGRIEDE